MNRFDNASIGLLKFHVKIMAEKSKIFSRDSVIKRLYPGVFPSICYEAIITRQAVIFLQIWRW